MLDNLIQQLLLTVVGGLLAVVAFDVINDRAKHSAFVVLIRIAAGLTSRVRIKDKLHGLLPLGKTTLKELRAIPMQRRVDLQRFEDRRDGFKRKHLDVRAYLLSKQREQSYVRADIKDAVAVAQGDPMAKISLIGEDLLVKEIRLVV